MQKSLVKFEGVLGLGSTSKHHFRTQGIEMLWNGTTKPRKTQRTTRGATTAAMIAPTRLPGAKPSNQKTLHLKDGREP